MLFYLTLSCFLLSCQTPEPEMSSSDLNQRDALILDLGVADLGEPDLGEPDLGEPDLEAPDAHIPDAHIPDAALIDELDMSPPLDQALPVSTCDDLLHNGDESDVDCGGSCAPCEQGGGCQSYRDCASQVCAGGRCLSPSCGDQLQNGDESDVDCGGRCAGCAPLARCSRHDDCANFVCVDGRCAEPRCGDGVVNGEEGCDDGNLVTEVCAYGEESCVVCDVSCVEVAGALRVCGDGVQDPEEACDPGELALTDCEYGEASCERCDAECHWVPGQTYTCGDGVLSTQWGEACDDGNIIAGDGCEPDCTITEGLAFYRDHVQPLIAAQCASCHVGERFAFLGLKREGDQFTEAETRLNYEVMLDMISFDAPTQSRLLTKVVPSEEPEHTQHAGDVVLEKSSEGYQTLLEWIELERQARCADCGLYATTQYLAYVDAPNLYWALERSPSRGDHGLRDGRAKIMLQPINPDTFEPQGEPIDFLDGQLCNEAGECDFGAISSNYAGDQLVFECRLPVQEGDDWLNDVNWNICIAEISAEGRALNPRLLMPEERQHRGKTFARGSPFGLYTDDGGPLKGVYDGHFRVRRSFDQTPIFSPDDQRVLLSSKGPDPRTGRRMTRTYHGFQFADNIISVNTDGSDPRVVYVNEGGTADSPFFLKDGQLAIHAWNLERMDRHLYLKTTPDGMMEQPLLFGRVQGPNMWGSATQLTNGLILGLTGRRRGAVELWLPFTADHTLGTSLEADLSSFTMLDPENDTHDPSFSYCRQPPDGQNCTVNRFYLDPAYSPDGRAFVALNPELTYVAQGEAMYQNYTQGSNTEERLASLTPYLPQSLGVWLLDHHGGREPFVEPDEGRMLRYPEWVGRRHRPRVIEERTDESVEWSELHIANVPLWLSFRHHNQGQNKRSLFQRLSTITSLRVLRKIGEDNDCLNDDRLYRNAVHGAHDHPTHLGISNGTGYERFYVPTEAGGDGWGDLALKSDGSVRARLPAGQLLLFQGVDEAGGVVTQHSRVFAMPPGHQVNTSVKRSQYRDQCSSCHGVIGSEPFVSLQDTDLLAAGPMDFDTEAARAELIDLTSPLVTRQTMTFVEQVEPIIEARCASCHVGASPAGELSLSSSYSSTANYPVASIAHRYNSSLLSFVPEEERVPGYDFSVPYSWYMRDGNREYREHPLYAPLVSAHAPLAELAPWSPAYQNLMIFEPGGARYLGGDGYASHYGRGDWLGGNSQNAWLIETLSGEEFDPRHTFEGPDHTSFVSEAELRTLRAVMDLGFPYTARCDDRLIPSGPNSGEPWGDPLVQSY